jgi:hypothetical protein
LDKKSCIPCPILGISANGVLLIPAGVWRNNPNSVFLIICKPYEKNCK